MSDSVYHITVFLALLAPLASFMSVGLIAKQSTRIITALSLLWSFAGLAASTTLLTASWDVPRIIALRWFTLGDNSFGADLAVSNYALLMLVVVSFISFAVHVYSTSYMHGDADVKRYFAMLGFFTFSMKGIVLSDNLLFLFIFWELVGFSSYMLIGHWTKKAEAGQAASKAFIMNRIGDAGFLIGLMILWTTHQTFSISEILAAPAQGWQTAASICIFCGVIGKSAQFPLFTWLPDAMEGPTPVSALIHAATMVAAGVYLLVRINGLFTPGALQVVTVTGMATALAGALAALSQYDIKKILAYSTMSQLGLMVLAIGTGAVDAALLHLLTHAFFKACLFLSAGMVIHSLHEAQATELHFDVQDIRHMGGLRRKMPVTFIAFLAGGSALAGIPFFSGFQSKEAMLTSMLVSPYGSSWLPVTVLLIVSFLTAVYTFRMIWFMFFGQERTIRGTAISEPGLAMSVPVVILTAASLWIVVSWNPFSFLGWFVTVRQSSPHAFWITLFSALWVLGALVASWLIFRKETIGSSILLRNAFYVDRFYRWVFGNALHVATRGVAYADKKVVDGSIHGLAYGQVIFAHVVSWFDRVFIDGTVNTTARLAGFGGKITRSLQGGNIQLYIFWSALAIIIFIIWAIK